MTRFRIPVAALLAGASIAVMATPAPGAVNDPGIGEQWAFAPTTILNVPAAWQISTGRGVTVAVIDSGTRLDHPDLAANVWTNFREVPNNGVDDDGNGYVDDVHG